jgi:hypothetical protein
MISPQHVYEVRTRKDKCGVDLICDALQEATITQLKKDFRATVAQLATRLDEQAAQIQKVNAQLEASKPAPQVVNNP